MPKTGGGTFGYVEQFNYPLSPCYNSQKNQVKAGWHSGGNGSCSRKPVEGMTSDQEMDGGGYFSWLFGDKKTTGTSTGSKGKKKSKSTTSTSKGKKKTSSTTSTASTSSSKDKKKTSSTTGKKKPSKK